MFIFALFCLLAVGSQANPLQPVVEPAQHIVIVTPQAQVHLEPALRYVHGLSPLARVSGPHHEETIVYVPAGAAASVVPTVTETGRAGGRQGEGFPQNINEIQQQAQQGVQVVTGQFGEAAAAAAAAGAGFFPGFFPSQDSSNKQEEKIETPANTQPLLAATEARHFYSLPQVYHTPVVDVVHTPVYSWPISAIRARSIQSEEAPIQQAPKLIAEEKATPELAPVLPEPQPLLKEQRPVEPFEQPAEQPLEQLAQTIIPAAIEASELKELKAEIASRQLEESNAIKDDLPIIEIEKEAIKEVIQETTKEAINSITEAIKEPIAEARKESSVEAIPEPIVEAIKEPSVEAIKEPIVEAVKQPIVEARKEPSVEARKEASQEEPAIQELAPVLIKEAVKEPSPEPIKEAPKESPIQPEPKLVEEEPSIKAIPIPVEAAIPEPQPQSQPVEAQPAIEPLPKAVEA